MLHHYILRPQADQLRAVGLLFDDGLHDEITKGSALNAVNTEGYRNDEFKAIHIIADAVVLPDMTEQKISNDMDKLIAKRERNRLSNEKTIGK